MLLAEPSLIFPKAFVCARTISDNNDDPLPSVTMSNPEHQPFLGPFAPISSSSQIRK